MAKVILEFDLVEDKYEMESALNGAKWRNLVWDLDQRLREELKYNDNLTGVGYEVVEKIREYLHEMKTANGLTLE